MVGYKLGYTSEAMRKQMHIDSPNWGRLTRAMYFNETDQPLLVHPRIEPEVALILGETLCRSDPSL